MKKLDFAGLIKCFGLQFLSAKSFSQEPPERPV